MTRIAVIGSGGQLGTDLCTALDRLGIAFVPLTRADADICDATAMAAVLAGVRPTAVLNTAAFHDVARCEEEPAHAFAVNATAVRDLARTCATLSCSLVHISTDYVFDGEQRTPYTEAALPRPINVYGTSKLAGEMFVRATSEANLVVRTSALYGLRGSSGKGGNFIETVFRVIGERGTMQVVDDQVTAPTFTGHLAACIVRLVRAGATGLVHATNAGRCSWFELASAVVARAGLQGTVTPTSTAAFTGATVARPAYSVLGSIRLHDLGGEPMPPWEEGLAAYLTARAERQAAASGGAQQAHR